MPDITVSFPSLSTDQVCTPTNTLNRYYCYRQKITSGNNAGNFTIRDTYILDGVDLYNVATEYNTYTGYSNNSSVTIYKVKAYQDLTGFWFPLISCIMVALIFYFVFRILFRRFIK